jgi:hypothetical protein
MNLNPEEAQKFVEMYESGRFNDLDARGKTQAKQQYDRVQWELDHPLDKTDDDPNAVLVPMGYVGFTTSLSQSPKLKTFALGSCLGLVSSGKSLVDLTDQLYTSGSLSHAAATLDTQGLVSRIITKHYQQGISPDDINFEIHATGSVDKKLLAEVKREIHNQTGQRDVKEDIRMVHSTAMLYDFETGRVYEIPKINLALPEYKKPTMIPPPHMPYEVVRDSRTEMDLGKLWQSFLGSRINNNYNTKNSTPRILV